MLQSTARKAKTQSELRIHDFLRIIEFSGSAKDYKTLEIFPEKTHQESSKENKWREQPIEDG